MQIATTKAIVTGGASGLGEATARALRSAGAEVTIFDRDSTRGAAIAAEIGAGFAAVDVTDAGVVATAVAGAAGAMGGLTACINCAGIATGKRTVSRDGPHDLDSFRRTIDINLIGSFNVLSQAAAIMAAAPPDANGERGVIVNTTSVAAFEGQKGQAAYAASKAGIAGMTLPIARDLGSLGIRVMAIAPGIFRTPMLINMGEEIMQGLAADVICPKRLGEPSEYADLVRFIIEARYLNGDVIRLDGALRLR